jgi:hypothetical protein
LDDPLKQAKAKAAATYDTAADHFDDEPLGFWKRIVSARWTAWHCLLSFPKTISVRSDDAVRTRLAQ